jgi:hypothetical protein
MLKGILAGARKSPPGGLFRPSRDHMQAGREPSARRPGMHFSWAITAGSAEKRNFP